jgi:hypothetical protein
MFLPNKKSADGGDPHSTFAHWLLKLYVALKKKSTILQEKIKPPSFQGLPRTFSERRPFSSNARLPFTCPSHCRGIMIPGADPPCKAWARDFA